MTKEKKRYAAKAVKAGLDIEWAAAMFLTGDARAAYQAAEAPAWAAYLAAIAPAYAAYEAARARAFVQAWRMMDSEKPQNRGGRP